MDLLPRALKPVGQARKLSARLNLEELESRLTPSTVISVNAAANVHPIDPNIYGSAFATTAQLADLNLTINREGGNSSDTYNWKVDDTNHASDWYYESIASGSGNGQTMDAFVNQTTAGGAQPDLTVPIMPYLATLGPNGTDLGSYPVSVYGTQQSTDPYNSNFGNGVTTNGNNITDTNPLYNYVANSTTFEQGWIQHLLDTFGTSGNGGVQYFTLGNEPGLWNSTHRDIHPDGETNTELLNDFINYGSMIKSIDPNAQILGPEEWGWTNYFVDGADAAAGNYGATYGNGLNVEQWLLQQLDQYQANNGTRLLDYFTLHYYPQESVSGDNNGGVDSNNVDQATELLRNQVTRSLWDPNYVDPSWIGTTGINGGVVDLIPTMQSWVNTYYPGTQTGITEYNFGAEGDMNGATTQADLFGIFGQQGLDLATRWTTPATDSPTYLAMKLWRNYDGNDSGFGDSSVSASVANPDQTDAFAAVRSSDGALTVAVINKNLYDPNNPSATTPVTVDLSGFANNGVSQEWQLAAVNPSDQTNAAITHLSDVDFSGNSFTVNVPMESVTMFVIEPAATSTTISATASNHNPSSYGELHSFTAKVADTSDPSVTPTGTVTFYSTVNGVTTTLPTVTLKNGVATLYTMALGAGNNTITATYNGAVGFPSSTTAMGVIQTVETANTTLAISMAGPNPSTYGEALTFTATVNDTSDTTVLPIGGKVTLFNGSTKLGIAIVVNGTTTISVATLGASTTPYAITASYSGTTNSANGMADYASVPTTSCNTLSQRVSTANTSTAFSVSGPNPSSYGEPLTLTATVSDKSDASVTPTGGTVTFFSTINNVQTILGTANMKKGTATLTTATVGIGSATLTATYNGTTNFVPSLPSPGISQTVNAANTSTALSVSGPSSPSYGEPLTLKATVANTSDPPCTPTGGIVTFYSTINSVQTTLGTATLTNGTASLATAAVGAGNATLTATYNGTTDFASSNPSPGTNQTVNTANTKTKVAAVPGNPSSPTYGETLKFTATVIDSSDPTVSITGGNGTVTFYDGTLKLGSVPVWNGTATVPSSQVSAGSNSITAVYNGNDNPVNGQADFAASLPSPAIKQPVGTANTSVTLAPASGNATATTYGQPLTFTATVTDTSDKTVILQMGTVTLYNKYNTSTQTKLAAFAVSNGTVSFIFPNAALNYRALAVSAAAYSITAVYTAPTNANGTTNFQTLTTSSLVSQTVSSEAVTSTGVTSSGNGSPIPFGQPVTFTATINNSASGSVVTPVGTVTFRDGTATDGTNGAILATTGAIDGVATFTTTRLSKGTHYIWAYFADRANNFVASNSDVMQVIV